MRPIIFAASAILAFGVVVALAQQSTPSSEHRVPLTQAAVALDAKGATALEGTLRTTALNGAPDAPITNVRIVIKNISPAVLDYASGLATFYDAGGVRCGEGLFKLSSLALNEAAETDAPGLRITCAPATWRIVATNLASKLAEQTSITAESTPATNLVISIDGEEHPIQLGKPMVLSLGEKKSTIVVRPAP